MSDVTRILSQIESGDPAAAEQLLPLVYEELRKLAAAKMAQERVDHTLQATELVHEAYVRLVKDDGARHWNSKGHFFAAAAEAMRRILIEIARHKRTLKAGGNQRQVERSEISLDPDMAWDLIDLDEALTRFECLEPQKAQLIKLRFFGGLSINQAAAALGISPATAKRHWIFARAWLYGELKGPDSAGPI